MDALLAGGGAQIVWSAGRLADAPGGVAAMPPTEDLFRTIWEVDRDWMPEIRRLIAAEERRGKQVHRLAALEEVSRFAETH